MTNKTLRTDQYLSIVDLYGHTNIIIRSIAALAQNLRGEVKDAG